MSSIGQSIPALLVAFQLFLTTGTAHAEDPATAEVLFQEGRRLMAEGQVSAACEKLKESFALDAASGTLLNLADCYEKAGKTATAWARFRQAASLAKNQGKTEQAAEANRRVKSIEPELSYLKIVVANPVPGLEVRRNDTEVTPAALGIDVPVDPGRIDVVVSAPGYREARQTVEVGARRDRLTVTIPKLVHSDETVEGTGTVSEGPRETTATTQDKKESIAATKEPPKEAELAKPEQQPAVDAPQPKRQESAGHGPGVLPWIIGGFGVAALATGGVFGYLALQTDEEAHNLCPTHQQCSKKALNRADLRDQQALVANIGVGVGLAAIATSAVWLIVGKPKGPSDEKSAFALQPAITPDTAALWASGRF